MDLPERGWTRQQLMQRFAEQVAAGAPPVEAFRSLPGRQNMSYNRAWAAARRWAGMPQVQARIREIREKSGEDAAATRKELIGRLTRQIRFDPASLIRPPATAGAPATLDYELLQQASAAGQIAAIELDREGNVKRIRPADGQRAVEQLIKLLGMAEPEKVDVSISGSLQELSEDELADLAQQLLDARKPTPPGESK